MSLGRTAGNGFSAAWSDFSPGDNGFTVRPGLTYAGLTTSGAAAGDAPALVFDGNARLYDPATYTSLVESGQYWVSFLFDVSSGYFSVNPFTGSGGINSVGRMELYSNGTIFLTGGGGWTGDRSENAAFNAGETVWLVGRVTTTGAADDGANDRLEIWVNPAPGVVPDDGDRVIDATFAFTQPANAGVIVQTNNAPTVTVDEYRVSQFFPGVDLGNQTGVFVTNGSTSNTIGGNSAGERNVISGNDESGVAFQGGATNNTVSGNYIGVDETGLMAAGNQAGVFFFGSGSGNIVGGSTPSERNIIAGNTEAGVELQSDSDGNFVVGNYIGVGADGTTTFTQLEGVAVVSGSSNNVIGGGPGEGNLILGHTNDGIRIAGPTSTLNAVSANTISDNGLLGIFLNDAPDNVVGTGTAGIATGLAGNTIDGNQNGVWIGGASATGNVVGGNLIGLGGAHDDGVVITSNASNNTIGGLTSPNET